MSKLEEDKKRLEKVMIRLVEKFEADHPGIYIRNIGYGGAHIENGRYLHLEAQIK